MTGLATTKISSALSKYPQTVTASGDQIKNEEGAADDLSTVDSNAMSIQEMHKNITTKLQNLKQLFEQEDR